MSSLIVTPIKGRVVRVIKLDACGAPVTGASSAVDVADGFLTVHATPQYEDGTEFVKKRADGTLCVNQKDPGTLKRISAESSWCVLDPDLRVIMDGARLLNSGGATGTGAMFTDALVTNRFSHETFETQAAWPAWGTMTTPTGFAPSAYLGATAQIQQGDHYGYNVTTLAPPAATTGAVLLA
jgi:hypothetical protein